jgi:chorismate mutase
MTCVRGIRGATTVERNEAELILEATRELLLAIVEQNKIEAEDVTSCFVTMTPDLNATFPAPAIRDVPGWTLVPLMCAQELEVPGSVERCIRLMLHVNTNKGQHEVQHVYLRGAVGLRPDLVQKQT